MDFVSKIFIIQSLSTTDTYKSGEELNKKLKASIPTDFKNVETSSELIAHLDKIKTTLAKAKGNYVIHFDCHGNEDGIEVFDNADNSTFLYWEDFRLKFREIYLASLQKPIISFSSCKGFNVVKLIAEFEPCPYHLVTGSFKNIGFEESVDGYFLFYDNLNKDNDIVNAIKETRGKYPALDFAAFTAEQLFIKGWEAYLKIQLTKERIQERKDKIKEYIISNTGTFTEQQELILNNCFTEQSTDEQYQRYRNIFFS